MRSQPIANVVLEFFQVAGNKSGSINDILKYYVETYGEDNSVELKKARHAVYLKANRLVKSGTLMVKEKRGNVVIFALPKLQTNKSTIAKKSIKPTRTRFADELKSLNRRETELEYELELCIAEAQGYEEMKSLVPSQLELLVMKKEEAKKRAIQLNGQLTSTRNIISAISA